LIIECFLGGCNRRGAHECLEAGQLLTNEDILTNGECIEVATVQEDSEHSRTHRKTSTARQIQSKNL